MVENVIAEIIAETKKDKDFFLNGGCLIFANILRGKVGGQLRWLVNENHAVVYHNKKLYDCTGNVTNKYKDSEYWDEETLMRHGKIVKGLKNKL